MPAKKKAVVSKRIMVSAKDTTDFVKIIAGWILTAEVKTASPSRAQEKIQVRVAWTDLDGRPGLGYLSMSTGDAGHLGNKHTSGPSVLEFLDDVFRLKQWAKTMSKEEHGGDYEWGAYHTDLQAELAAQGILAPDSKLFALHKQAMETIRECVKAGTHKSARRTRNQTRAKDFLERNIAFAINNGVTDAEIQEIVKLSFIKHTMES